MNVRRTLNLHGAGYTIYDYAIGNHIAMNNKTIFWGIGILVVGILAFYGLNAGRGADTTGVLPEVEMGAINESVKEFTMTSWVETTADGNMSPHFSLGEMRVKKGDRVRITITNTAGTHDFSLDEFGIREETPLNEPVVVEFVADKTGSFEYYCSKFNHRALGQKGTLVVEE